MKLRIQTLTGQIEEVEADQLDSILDLKVSGSVKRELDSNRIQLN